MNLGVFVLALLTGVDYCRMILTLVHNVPNIMNLGSLFQKDNDGARGGGAPGECRTSANIVEENDPGFIIPES